MLSRSRKQLIPLALVAAILLALSSSAQAKPKLLPKPQQVEWLKGEGPAGALAVIALDKIAGTVAQPLYDAFRKKLPEAGLGTEGYLLQVSPEHTLIITAHQWGYLRAMQTLQQLRAANGDYTYCQIADWPNGVWRGVHMLTPGADKQPLVLRFIQEVLVPLKCNAIVYQIDYHYQFSSHKDIQEEDSWSKQQVRELAALCQENGIMLIPMMNCLGHQSWKHYPPHAMLRAHPEFEEPPEIPVTSKDFYCRSWCPLHPQVNSVAFALIDELIDAFQSKLFHVGLDEVFLIASEKCPRCRGKDPAELFAKAINDLYAHVTTKRGNRMLMWGD